MLGKDFDSVLGGPHLPGSEEEGEGELERETDTDTETRTKERKESHECHRQHFESFSRMHAHEAACVPIPRQVVNVLERVGACIQEAVCGGICPGIQTDDGRGCLWFVSVCAIRLVCLMAVCGAETLRGRAWLSESATWLHPYHESRNAWLIPPSLTTHGLATS